MDDYLVGMVVFILCGLLILFLSSVLANHQKETPEEDENDIWEKKKSLKKNKPIDNSMQSNGNNTSGDLLINSNGQSNSAYDRMILRYQDRTNPFSQLEALFYIVAIGLLGYAVNGPVWYFFGYLSILLIALLFLRSIVYALGTRVADSVFRKVYKFIILLANTTLPVSILLKRIRVSIGGSGLTEDSREEIETLVDSAKEDGSLDDSEYRLLKNIMGFSEVLVSDVMTPRTVVFSLPETTTVGDAVKLKEIKNYSRIPIFSGNSLDEGVKAYVTARDVLAAYAEGQLDKPLADLGRKIYFVIDTLELNKALEEFLLKQQHLLIVIDEYGGVDGLLTMEDVLETILGVEIVDEADTITDLRKLAKKTRDFRQKRKRL